ncbi:MAG: amidohydrolase family protein [Isosphaeraceae bacterium]
MRLRDLTVSARYVFPVEGPPMAGGLLHIEHGRIKAVEPAGTRSPDLDLGNVAILPGFVNAHTHLELAPIGEPADPLADPVVEDEIAWLERVIAQRRGRNSPDLARQASENVRKAVEAGTTLLADTTTAGLSWPAIASAPVRGVVFAELIGLRAERAAQTVADAEVWLSTIKPEDQVAANARPGLSPHAPYSTAGWLYRHAAGSGLPLSTHLAEMPEELGLLSGRSGGLRGFLERLGAWDPDWEPIGDRPADYIRKGGLRRADWLVAHGNYFEPEDFWQFRPEASPDGRRVAIAYCPRTHARFGHKPHPARALMEQGAVVCLGTDSLASAPSLSILEEARFLKRRHPEFPGPLLLAMATLFGAWALRAETVTGSLRPGKSADLAIIALPDRDDEDPHALILESDRPVVGTVFEGRLHHRAGDLAPID